MGKPRLAPRAAAGFVVVLWMLLHCGSELVAAVPPDGWYDYAAYTDCRGQPEPALYNGGILKFGNSDDPDGYRTTETGVFSPAFVVYNLNKTTMYTFSCELLHACSPPFQCDELLQSCELQ